MKSLLEQRERYLYDTAPVRLGNLASELLRLGAWIRMRRDDEAIVGQMRRIAWLIEWNADCSSAELADIQREICAWRRTWPIDAERLTVASRARLMSSRVIQLSGLLDA